MNNNVVLLSEVYDYFLNECSRLSLRCNIDVLCPLSVHKLILTFQATFGGDLECYAQPDQIGCQALLIWPGIDLKQFLLKIMLKDYFKIKSEEREHTNSTEQCKTREADTQTDKESVDSHVETVTANFEGISLDDHLSTSETKILNESSCIIRKKLLSLCKTLEPLSNDAALTTLHISDIIEKYMDPIVWNFFSKLCMTEREWHANVNVNWEKINVCNTEEKSVWVRNLKRLYLISVCNYQISHGRCNFPFHMLIADVVDKYTKSSSKCVQILNTLGICVSSTTLERFQTSKALENFELSIYMHINPNNFNYISIDNLSYWDRHSRVRSTDQSRGLNCTSYMIGEPKPGVLCLGDDDKGQFFKDSVVDTDGNRFLCVHSKGKNIESLGKALACILDPNLLKCVRDCGSVPAEDQTQLIEEYLGNALCTSITQDMVENISFFKQYFSLNTSILDFSYRLENIILNQEKPGEPEYMALLKLSGSPVEIYRPNEDLITKECTISADIHADNSPLRLLANEHNSYTAYSSLITEKDFDKSECLLSNSLNPFEGMQNKNNINFEDKSTSYMALFLNTAKQDFQLGHNIENDAQKNRKRSFEPNSIKQQIISSNLSELINVENKSQYNNICLNDLNVTPIENEAAVQCHTQLFEYISCKYAFSKYSSHSSGSFLPGLKVFLSQKDASEVTKSAFHYFGLLNENCESRETIENMLHRIYTTMGAGTFLEHVLVVGDGKTYDYLMKLKLEHGAGLNWLLPFPGDWHILKNFSLLLMKVYGDAGLKELV